MKIFIGYNFMIKTYICAFTKLKGSNFTATSYREQVTYQWDNEEICFVLDQHAKLDFYSASSLKQQSVDRYVVPLWHIWWECMAINEGGLLYWRNFFLRKALSQKNDQFFFFKNLPQATAASYHVNAWSVALSNMRYSVMFRSKA